MHIQQIYTGCLAQGAYYISSENEAAIIDPLRDITNYLHLIEQNKVQLKYIFETHFHADFVSGHIDLSHATNAPIVYGPNANCGFSAIIAQDEQVFTIGKIKIKAIHTPGHTLESTCYLLIDENGVENALFSGDTLFVGDVGRPDLAQASMDMDSKTLASILYKSLRTKIMTLPDNVIVYPAHGAGSACGKNMSKETMSTIGQQKLLNYALRADMTETEFIDAVLEDLNPVPAYFKMNVTLNQQGYNSFESIIKQGLTPLDLKSFEHVIKNNKIIILDTRPGKIFIKGFIPNSINIGLNGDFAPWVGTLFQDVNQKIVLVTEIGKEEESITRLSRVGFDNIIGYLDGGLETWKEAGKPIQEINQITANHFWTKTHNNYPKPIVLDVRKQSEYIAGHIEHAILCPLASINDWIYHLDPNQKYYLYCGSGYRSIIASSILISRSFNNIVEIFGGYKHIISEKIHA